MDVYMQVLGTMQDAGLPHIGCTCPRCLAVAGQPPLRLAASVAVVDRRREPAGVWLVDATPDVKYQLAALADVLGPHPARPRRMRQPDGFFLTHAHMGHVAGLPQLGPEGMHVHDLPLYGSAPLLAHLQRMPLWAPLLNGVRPTRLVGHRPVHLADDLALTPIPVRHRDETGSGTFGFHVRGPHRRALYLPDIDSWADWSAAPELMVDTDVALVDASFYRRDELPGRAPVAHPLVPDTLAFWQAWPGELWLTHLNHTNPVLDAESAERAAVEAAGVRIAAEGNVIPL